MNQSQRTAKIANTNSLNLLTRRHASTYRNGCRHWRQLYQLPPACQRSSKRQPAYQYGLLRPRLLYIASTRATVKLVGRRSPTAKYPGVPVAVIQQDRFQKAVSQIVNGVAAGGPKPASYTNISLCHTRQVGTSRCLMAKTLTERHTGTPETITAERRPHCGW